MYVELNIEFIEEKPGGQFELAIEFACHLGYIVGGGCSGRQAVLYIEIHDCDCGAYPKTTELVPEHMDAIKNYLDKRGFKYTFQYKQGEED